ncbi:transferrin receptor protein 1 [Latimeria chalumnae]|uniref:transferrin receptor protein 1 n=1 Tax=Latimeria chalumnae TaxID=7897 RepID=UPI00313D5FDC
MSQTLLTLGNLFDSMPKKYTRFSLTRQMDGDGSEVEMKLSEDEEIGENAMCNNTQTSVVKTRDNRRNFCFIVIAALLLFLVGFLIGYAAFHSRMARESDTSCPIASAASQTGDADEQVYVQPVERVLYLNDLIPMLSENLKSSRFMDTISKMARNNIEAGSEEDYKLCTEMHHRFSSCGLSKIWEDRHYVRLQFPDKNNTNKVMIVNTNLSKAEDIDIPSDSYLAYSPSGTATGKLVYANYGRKEDFEYLEKQNVNVTGCIVIVRAGRNPAAEKVANTENMKAAGVLIYPDPKDYNNFPSGAGLFGHVHFGTGDPYTPGFPSFNRTQFPPVKSSGLPGIPAQTISAKAAEKLLSLMDGAEVNWKGGFSVNYRMGPGFRDGRLVKMEVNNVDTERAIYNVFGVLKGFVEPEHYLVIGAQRDSMGPGAAKSAVGTSLLLELACALSAMVKDGYKPRRSIVFVSWSGGDFGAVGATEWLEGYLTTLQSKAFAFINLDAAVLGDKDLRVSGSPLLYSLFEKTIKEVKSPLDPDNSIYNSIGSENWEAKAVVPMRMDDGAYPFLAFSGIPSLSFSFTRTDDPYPYLGTKEDTLERLQAFLKPKLEDVTRTVAELVGQMAIQLTHDHELNLDYARYSTKLLQFIRKVFSYKEQLKNMGLTFQWLSSANGDFKRAATKLTMDYSGTDMEDKMASRVINDRIMKVECNFLSPYASPEETPFRHIFFGSGPHTLNAMLENLDVLKHNSTIENVNLLKKQLALLTWTIQGAANALTGDVWEIDNEF